MTRRSRSKARRPATRRSSPPVGRRLPWLQIGSVTLGAALVVAVAVGLVYVLDRPLTRLVIEAPFDNVTAAEIHTAVQPLLLGGFVSVDLEHVRRAVAALAWVDTVQIRRSWPDGIAVQISEQQALARWGDAGLVNHRGELFLTGAHPLMTSLPHLDGPPGSEERVASRYRELSADLGEAGLEIAALTLDARGAWTMSLAAGPEVRFGRQELELRVRRFLRVVASPLARRFDAIRYIDMRYSNGFAVGWQEQPAGSPGSEEEAPANV